MTFVLENCIEDCGAGLVLLSGALILVNLNWRVKISSLQELNTYSLHFRRALLLYICLTSLASSSSSAMAVCRSDGVTLQVMKISEQIYSNHLPHLVHQHGIVDPGVVHGVSDGADDEVIRTTGLVLQTSEQIGETERRVSNEEEKYRDSQ